MTIRSFFGGLLIMAGCAATVLSATAMFLSMQMEGGGGLLIGLAGLGGGIAVLTLGGVILLFQR